jgi:hypothetical protein
MTPTRAPVGARAPAKVIERIRRICLDLPEAVEKPFGGHTSPAFRVRDKLFVMIAEARTSMTLKAPKGAQEILVNADPERFFVPPYVGPKGWVGVQIALKAAPDWDEVAELICESYCLTAPKRLVAQWEAGRED